MKHLITKNTYKTLIVLVLFTGLFSCKSSREMVRVENLRPMSASRMLKTLENNSFNYKEMEMGRISCQYVSNNQNISFRGTVRAVNNEKIWISFNKMNVPVGKLLLTPDSVKFINYIEKSYLLGNFDYLSNLLNMDIDFETVNAILSNNAFSYRDDKRNKDFREFISEVDSGMYVLKSIKDRKLDKIMRGGNDRKIDRLLKKMDESKLILQTLYIDSNFKLRKVVLDDQLNSRMIIIGFDDFMKVGRQLYPGEINMQFVSLKDNLHMKIKVGKVSMEKKQNYSFKIPERYQPMKLK